MAKQESDTGVINKLAGRGEEAVNRLMEELGKNERVTEALARAMEAKGKVDERTRKTLGTVGLAAADQIEGLRNQLEALEKRLAALEKTERTGKGATTGGAATKRATSARSSTAKPKPTASKSKSSSASPEAKKQSPGSGSGSGPGPGSS